MLVACSKALLSGPLDSLGCLHGLSNPRGICTPELRERLHSFLAINVGAEKQNHHGERVGVRVSLKQSSKPRTVPFEFSFVCFCLFVK